MRTPCPNCGAPVELDRSASASADCPDCGTVVRRTTISAAASDWQPTSSVLKAQFGILLAILLGSAAIAGPLRVRFEDTPAVCAVPVLLLVYFLCICICASAPDRTAKRSIVACLLTLVFGTAGLFGGAFAVFALEAPGLPFMTEWGIGLGAFAVYFSAFVFLIRFHAAVALAFGNRSLARECYVYLLVPIIVILVNMAVERSRFARVDFRVPERLELARTLFNFGIVVWFAMIVLRTFRTIDRGPLARSDDYGYGYDDASLG